jgi:hypothetical protein
MQSGRAAESMTRNPVDGEEPRVGSHGASILKHELDFSQGHLSGFAQACQKGAP